MTQELRLLESHIGSLEQGIKIINEFFWGIIVAKRETQWAVWSGEKIIFATDTLPAPEAFLYGMALSYAILPDECQKIVDEMLDLDIDPVQDVVEDEWLLSELRKQGWNILYT